MKISKSTDKQIRAFALEFAGDLDDYSETLTQKALSPATDTQDLIDEMRGAMNELEGDTFPTYEKWLNNAFYKSQLKEKLPEAETETETVA